MIACPTVCHSARPMGGIGTRSRLAMARVPQWEQNQAAHQAAIAIASILSEWKIWWPVTSAARRSPCEDEDGPAHCCNVACCPKLPPLGNILVVPSCADSSCADLGNQGRLDLRALCESCVPAVPRFRRCASLHGIGSSWSWPELWSEVSLEVRGCGPRPRRGRRACRSKGPGVADRLDQFGCDRVGLRAPRMKRSWTLSVPWWEVARGKGVRTR